MNFSKNIQYTQRRVLPNRKYVKKHYENVNFLNNLALKHIKNFFFILIAFT